MVLDMMHSSKKPTYILFQVVWLGRETCDVTWEPADKVPASVIDEFEKGATPSMKESIASAGVGQTIHTLTVEENKNPVSFKQPSRIVVKENKGCVSSTL